MIRKRGAEMIGEGGGSNLHSAKASRGWAGSLDRERAGASRLRSHTRATDANESHHQRAPAAQHHWWWASFGALNVGPVHNDLR